MLEADDVIEIRSVISGGACGDEVHALQGARARSSCASTTPASAAPASSSTSSARSSAPSPRSTCSATDEAVLVAVSGGKDSLALWDVLIELGYKTTGLHLSLGIGTYSDHSTAKTVAFASARDLPLITVPLADEGLAVPGDRRPHAPAGLLGVRDDEAPLLRSAGDRPRLSGRRHRPQPRRRSGAPARQRAALADGAPGPPAPGARADARALRAQGEAALSAAASTRRPCTRSSAASTTSSTNARTPPAPPSCSTRTCSTDSRPPARAAS